jgi:hypothetical protein
MGEYGFEHVGNPSQTGDRAAYISKSAIILDAMANRNRLAVLTQLVKQETNVNDLSQTVGLGHRHCHSISPSCAWPNWSPRDGARRRSYSCNSIAVIQILALLRDLFPKEILPA